MSSGAIWIAGIYISALRALNVKIVVMNICWHSRAIHTAPPLLKLKLVLINNGQPEVIYPFFALTASKHLPDLRTNIVPGHRQDVPLLYLLFAIW